MARIIKENIITSIDIGTTKICVLVGKKIGDHIEIIGIGKAPSSGLKKGVVVDIAKTTQAIHYAVKEAEMMAGIKIDTACIGISGSHISALTSSGVIAIKNDIIKPHDVTNVLDAAQALSIEQGYQILHVLPQYFVINGKDRIQDPVGMHAVRLEVQVHIITGAVASVNNLLHCCQAIGITVHDIILEQLASAAAVLSDDEIELGVGMLDIGGGTSDLALYKNNAVQHTMVLPVAGNHVTQDIAIGFRVMKKEAERIKKEYGLACLSLMEEEKLLEVEMMHGNDLHVVRLSDLVRIIEFRMKELFMLVRNEIKKNNNHHIITNGLVLTGGGSLMNGAQHLAETIFDCPVRIGKPRVFFDLLETLQSPLYATGYGLLLYVLHNEKKIMKQMHDGPMMQRIVERMKSWVADFF